LINRGQVDYGGGEVGFSQEESGRGFFGDMAAAANAMGFGPDPSNDPSNDPSSAHRAWALEKGVLVLVMKELEVMVD
jgi:hypothetical protein